MKVLIVDDEPPARDRLRELLRETGEHQVVGEAANGREALEVAANTNPDVVLLDIRMPGMDGIEAAQHLNRMEIPPAVVFTTAYDEYAIDAFDANAIGYVLKPVRLRKLEKALQQAARLTSEALTEFSARTGVSDRRKHICARLHGNLKLIPVSEVHYFVADQKYVSVVHDKGRDLIEDSLKSLETEFGEQFVRIHRGAVVALNSIESLEKDKDGQTIVVTRVDSGDDELIVSRRHVANVKRRLKKG